MAEKNLPPQEEEVDLGNLFKVIGKGIRSFFEAIWFFFTQVFHYFVLFLIFLKRHAVQLGIALVLGFIVGFVLHKMEPKAYVSEMILETNFGSGKLLYKQIGYLNELIKKKDSVSVSQTLGIDVHEAAQITKIEVSPFQPKKYLFIAYDEFREQTDTIITKDFTFDDFKKRMLDDDLRYHQILVTAKSRLVFSQLSGSFLKLLENDYFRNLKNIKVRELQHKLQILNKNLAEIDSLRKTYKEIALKEAENRVSTAVLEIAKNDKNDRENDIRLFGIADELLKNIAETNRELIRNSDVVNVISDFDEIGVPDKKLLHKKYAQLALLFGGLMLVWILLRQLNTYLKNYKKNH